jgi:hypothetical protein
MAEQRGRSWTELLTLRRGPHILARKHGCTAPIELLCCNSYGRVTVDCGVFAGVLRGRMRHASRTAAPCVLTHVGPSWMR